MGTYEHSRHNKPFSRKDFKNNKIMLWLWGLESPEIKKWNETKEKEFG
jgi:hypothetical protein